jgi:hypothetical protein
MLFGSDIYYRFWTSLQLADSACTMQHCTWKLEKETAWKCSQLRQDTLQINSSMHRIKLMLRCSRFPSLLGRAVPELD